MITETCSRPLHVLRRDRQDGRRRRTDATSGGQEASQSCPARRCGPLNSRRRCPGAADWFAEGVTEVSEIHHIDRGYVRFDEQLRASAPCHPCRSEIFLDPTTARACSSHYPHQDVVAVDLQARQGARIPSPPQFWPAGLVIGSLGTAPAEQAEVGSRSVSGRPVRGLEGVKTSARPGPAALRSRKR